MWNEKYAGGMSGALSAGRGYGIRSGHCVLPGLDEAILAGRSMRGGMGAAMASLPGIASSKYGMMAGGAALTGTAIGLAHRHHKRAMSSGSGGLQGRSSGGMMY